MSVHIRATSKGAWSTGTRVFRVPSGRHTPRARQIRPVVAGYAPCPGHLAHVPLPIGAPIKTRALHAPSIRRRPLYLLREELEVGGGLGDLELLLVHVRRDVSEERGREVPLAGVREHGEDDRALRRVLGRLDGRPHGRAARNAGKDALCARELLRGGHRHAVWDRDELVHDLKLHAVLKHLGDEIRRPALNGVRRESGVRLGRRAVGVARGRGAAREEARARRLGEDDLDVRAALLDGLARSVEGTAGAVAGDPVVKVLALEVVEDLLAGGLLVELPVSLGLELVAEEPAVLLGELGGLGDHAGALVLLRGDDHLRAEHAHELAALDAERLRHGDDALVAALGCKHGNGDAGVARGGLDNGVARLEETLRLGVLDDGEGEAVLDGRERVEVFALGVDRATLRTHAVVNLDDRRVANGLRNVLEDTAAGAALRDHGDGGAARASTARAGSHERGGRDGQEGGDESGLHRYSTGGGFVVSRVVATRG
mmetsp:Transcript_96025/g.273767  ORF Transcript_96025/g.273767 Transcript_96025/m.273767 type:complete len:486 (-) Transcript_96025:54-1511(-)